MYIRPIVKVLYTFDDDHKTNCLARWPQLLDIQTAQLDEKTQIGVIELKTCIQAIVSARFAALLLILHRSGLITISLQSGTRCKAGSRLYRLRLRLFRI